MTPQQLAFVASLFMLPSAAYAQTTWKLLEPSAVNAADRERILELAAKAGLEGPLEARENIVMPIPSRIVVVSTAKKRAGLCRSWQSLWFTDGGREAAAANGPFTHQWRQSGEVETLRKWLVEDGGVRAWVFLLEYYSDRVHAITYDEARPVILAFIRGTVVDARDRQHSPVWERDRPLPIGRRAELIDGIESSSEGWTVTADGWHFAVSHRQGRYRVTSSSFPIP